MREQVEAGAINPAHLHFHNLDVTDNQIKQLNGYESSLINFRLYHVLINGKREYLSIIKRMNQLRIDIENNGKILGNWPITILPTYSQQQLKKGFEDVELAKCNDCSCIEIGKTKPPIAENKLSIDKLFNIPLKEQFRG